jgi:D-sedoheptulose 7-phosphate isomerase
MSNELLHSNIAAAVRTFQSVGNLADDLDSAAAVVADALAAGHKLLVCGNGGSAADAMHLATEFVCRFMHDRPALPAICLTANGADLTAIGNDYAFEQAFSRQVEAFGRPGDVLIVFSSSGRSQNLRLALEAASARSVRSVAFLGKGGGFCAGLADVDLIVPGDVTARIQEAQKLLLHTLCELVEARLGYTA